MNGSELVLLNLAGARFDAFLTFYGISSFTGSVSWLFYCLGLFAICCISEQQKSSSLQALGLPAANPAYPSTCSNPFAGLKSFFTFRNSNPKTLKPKTPRSKTLNPENLKSNSLHIASVFIPPLVISISYCLDVLFECGRTRGLRGNVLHLIFGHCLLHFGASTFPLHLEAYLHRVWLSAGIKMPFWAEICSWHCAPWFTDSSLTCSMFAAVWSKHLYFTGSLHVHYICTTLKRHNAIWWVHVTSWNWTFVMHMASAALLYQHLAMFFCLLMFLGIGERSTPHSRIPGLPPSDKSRFLNHWPNFAPLLKQKANPNIKEWQ